MKVYDYRIEEKLNVDTMKQPVYHYVEYHPSYCCPKCGEQIGWLGGFFNFFIPNYHRCENE